MHILTVETAESGAKLIGFLARRLEGHTDAGELHRWIRSGQVRVNGKRARAFDRLDAGDAVRLPPFAAGNARHESRAVSVNAGDLLACGLRVLAVTAEVLALEKPASLPSQPGTGHRNSVSAILRDHFAGAAHIPAPAHRLDKMTSGILLAGMTREAQEKLHALFARIDSGIVEKTYLAWVSGIWPHTDEHTLVDHLAKQAAPNSARPPREIMLPVDATAGKEARCRVLCLEMRKTPVGAASLLRIALETGRTHQIRAQLSIRHFPIIGDMKYGGPPFARMLLHAYTLAFDWRGESLAFAAPPSWPDPFAVALPPFVA